eukprot:g75989.t1
MYCFWRPNDNDRSRDIYDLTHDLFLFLFHLSSVACQERRLEIETSSSLTWHHHTPKRSDKNIQTTIFNSHRRSQSAQEATKFPTDNSVIAVGAIDPKSTFKAQVLELRRLTLTSFDLQEFSSLYGPGCDAFPRQRGPKREMPSLKLQKRLAASVLKCGKRKVWLDPNETNEIHNANSRHNCRKLIKDGYIVKKPVAIHSRARVNAYTQAKRLGRHTGTGKRKGTREARFPGKVIWMRRMRVLRRMLHKYRAAQKLDKHLYHELYLKVKGNVFKNKRVLMEHIHSAKSEQARMRDLMDAAVQRKLRATNKRARRNKTKEEAAAEVAAEKPVKMQKTGKEKTEKKPKADKEAKKAEKAEKKAEKAAKADKAEKPEKKAEKAEKKPEKKPAKAEKAAEKPAAKKEKAAEKPKAEKKPEKKEKKAKGKGGK